MFKKIVMAVLAATMLMASPAVRVFAQDSQTQEQEKPAEGDQKPAEEGEKQQ